MTAATLGASAAVPASACTSDAATTVCCGVSPVAAGVAEADRVAVLVELRHDGLEDLLVGHALDEVRVGPGEALDRRLVALVLRAHLDPTARARGTRRGRDPGARRRGRRSARGASPGGSASTVCSLLAAALAGASTERVGRRLRAHVLVQRRRSRPATNRPTRGTRPGTRATTRRRPCSRARRRSPSRPTPAARSRSPARRRHPARTTCQHEPRRRRARTAGRAPRARRAPAPAAPAPTAAARPRRALAAAPDRPGRSLGDLASAAVVAGRLSARPWLATRGRDRLRRRRRSVRRGPSTARPPVRSRRARRPSVDVTRRPATRRSGVEPRLQDHRGGRGVDALSLCPLPLAAPGGGVSEVALGDHRGEALIVGVDLDAGRARRPR